MTEWEDTGESEALSKTAKKKLMHELQDLGGALVELSPKQFNRLLEKSGLTLGDSLLGEIEQARKLKPGNSRRRQLQRIGKLIREEDYKSIQQYLSTYSHR